MRSDFSFNTIYFGLRLKILSYPRRQREVYYANRNSNIQINEVYVANEPKFLGAIFYETQQVEPQLLMAYQVHSYERAGNKNCLSWVSFVGLRLIILNRTVRLFDSAPINPNDTRRDYCTLLLLLFSSH